MPPLASLSNSVEIGHQTCIISLSLSQDIPKGPRHLSGMAAHDDLIHGWHSPNCGRGTSDILWSCLATILLCVWTVIHLPVPCWSRYENGQLVPGEPARSLRNWVIRSGIVPAVISVIAPEFLTFTAIGEFLISWRVKRELSKMKWTLTHAFFLQMGGFCLETHSGIRLQLDMDDLRSATSASVDWFSNLENISEDQINDHAKSNPLTKFIACGQTLWLVTQVVTRVYKHQAVTLLEVSTSAYVACALTAYLFWWKKPQNPTLPITILCPEEALPRKKVAEKSVYYNEKSIEEYFWAGQYWTKHTNELSDFMDFALFALCPAVFGAIHVASWNIRLLTNVEQWLWRGSALYCCTAGAMPYLLVYSTAVCKEHSLIRETTEEAIDIFATLAILLVYIILRLFMIVEVFLSLRALSPSAYEEVQWSSLVPHI